jgi:outer membrane protein assembly factor BamB
MRRCLLPAIVFITASCFLVRPRVAPYPKGVVFPLEEAGRLTYDGEINRVMIRDGARAYFSTDKGAVCCVDIAKQAILWEYQASSPISRPPAFGHNHIYACDENQIIYALDLDGRLLWRTELKETISSDISVAPGSLHVGTQEGHLLALDPASGDIRWSFEAGSALEAAPVAWADAVVAGCTDGRLYLINSQGRLRSALVVGSPIRVAPLVDGNRVYLGTDDLFIYCLDLVSGHRKWRIKAGGKLTAPPRADQKRAFFLTSNCVLYALDKHGGDILWWWITPSRSPYLLELSSGQVMLTSLSPLLCGLENRTGAEIGRYDAAEEIRSNPLWFEPFLLVNLYDFSTGQGRLVYLRKQVRVELAASLPSPQSVGTEVTFTASPVGLHLPQYEFSVRPKDAEKTIVQPLSARKFWVWYPDKEGKYVINVKAADERETKEAEIPFEIVKKQQ